MNDLLRQALAAHHLDPEASGTQWSARIVQANDLGGCWTVQLDLGLSGGPLGERVLIESCGGLGADRAEAERDAFANLLQGSLHPLLALASPAHRESDQLAWARWGTFRACLGPVTGRGQQPELGYPDFLDALRARVEAAELAPEPHWLRAFCMQSEGRVSAEELLLDNEPWPEAVAVVRAHPWPATPGFYTVRQFLFLEPLAG